MSESKNPPKDLYAPQKYGWTYRPEELENEPRLSTHQVFRSYLILQSTIWGFKLEGFVNPNKIPTLKTLITKTKKELLKTQNDAIEKFHLKIEPESVTGYLLERGNPAGELLAQIERTIQGAGYFVQQRSEQKEVIAENQADETFPKPVSVVLGKDVVPENYADFKVETWRYCKTEGCNDAFTQIQREENRYFQSGRWHYAQQNPFEVRREPLRLRERIVEDPKCKCGLCIWVETFCPQCRTYTKYKTRYKTRG